MGFVFRFIKLFFSFFFGIRLKNFDWIRIEIFSCQYVVQLMLYDAKFKVKDWHCDGVWGLSGIIGVTLVETVVSLQKYSNSGVIKMFDFEIVTSSI